MHVRELLRNRRYALYLLSRSSFIVATQMISVAVGWQVYDITKKPLALAFSGLALFLPAFLLALVGGHVADRRDRRTIIIVCHLGVALCASVLAGRSYVGARDLLPIYSVLVLLGTIRAFSGPAGSALMPSLIAKEALQPAIALGSSTWQLAMILGPSLGGAIYAASGAAHWVYALSSTLALVAAVAVLAIGPAAEKKRTAEPASWTTVLAGLRYVFANKPILGAVSLDLFAVLLGGSVALFPIFARDVLEIGPSGLGVLRSAPAVGAASVALVLAQRPVRRYAGPVMFACVLLFGIATIVFGVSRTFAVSLVALLVLGASDMVSVVIRSTLVQMRTPDEMRGRVSAVNLVFIGASNELGEFESGVTAALLGAETAVIVGGVGTCLVVIAWAFLFPQLRKVDQV